MAKAGAILATGILDAGGRNVVVSLQSRAGFTKMGSVVGLMLWLQHWLVLVLLSSSTIQCVVTLNATQLPILALFCSVLFCDFQRALYR